MRGCLEIDENREPCAWRRSLLRSVMEDGEPKGDAGRDASALALDTSGPLEGTRGEDYGDSR